VRLQEVRSRRSPHLPVPQLPRSEEDRHRTRRRHRAGPH
jgi:hypothetical protein